MNALESRLDAIVAKTARDRELSGVVVRVERPEDGFGWTGSRGDLGPDRPFFIASTT